VKSAEEIMNILEAYDLTGSLRDAGELAGCSHHTVARYVRAREEGRLVPGASAPRPGVIDAFLPKLEELVERSKGRIRADVAHEKITAMGYAGSERTTRRAVARLKKAWHPGRRRVFRPWIPEPGMWAQYDFGDGPEVNGAATVLFCLWLAWSRFRVVLPLLDKTQASVWAAADMALRRAGGVPAYLLTDNEKTVTVEHVAGIPVRNPGAVEFGRHYGLTVATCVPYDRRPRAGRSPRSSWPGPTWSRRPRTCSASTAASPRWRLRAPCSASRTAPGRTGSPAGPRRRCSPTSGPGCIRFRPRRSPRRWA
jgi:hypothetical protein